MPVKWVFWACEKCLNCIMSNPKNLFWPGHLIDRLASLESGFDKTAGQKSQGFVFHCSLLCRWGYEAGDSLNCQTLCPE